MSENLISESQDLKPANNGALDAELERIFDTISAQDLFGMCIECLSLSERDIGKPTKPYGATKEQLKIYVRSAFDAVFQRTGEEKLLEATEKSPEVQVDLLVTIVQAEDLVAKDVSGMSDPYCVLRVGSSPAQHSTVKHKTVNPSWNEAFQIRIEDPANDAFRVEVWDKDPRSLYGVCEELYDVRSCASCLFFVRELLEVLCCHSQVDDFMGSAVKFINELPCTGGEMWLQLKDKRFQGAYGKIYLKFGFKYPSSEDPVTWGVLKYHYYLSLVFLLHRATAVHPEIVLSWCQWDECLDEEGLTLLFRHALSKSLVEIELCFCRITALANVSRSNKVRVNFSVLYELLARMKNLVQKSHNPLISNALEKVLKTLSSSCLAHFNRLHEQFSFEKKHQRIDLQGLLYSCINIEALASIEITDHASIYIRKEAAVWYTSLVNRDQLRTEGPALFCECLGSVLSNIQTYHEEADKMFKAAWNETYSQIVRKELDEFLSETFRPGLGELCSKLQKEKKDTKTCNLQKVELTIEAFHRLHGFVSVLNNVLPSEREQLELDSFQDWFGSDTVTLWFDFAKAPVCGWISDLVSKDNMSPLARDLKYGTAVRDTLDIFRSRFVQLWEKLQFRDFECALAFSTCVSEGGRHFSKTMAARIAAEGHFDVVGEFKISKQLCVAISSLAVMSSFLQSTISQMEHSLSTDSDLAFKVGEVVFSLEQALGETITTITSVCSEAVDKLKPELCARLSEVSNASSDFLQEKKLYMLERYVNAFVSTLMENLEAIALRMMLRSLWRCAVSAVRAEAVLIQESYFYRFTTAYLGYAGLHQALLQMKSAFNACGKGLPEDDITITSYVDLERRLTAIVDSLGSDGADASTQPAHVVSV